MAAARHYAQRIARKHAVVVSQEVIVSLAFLVFCWMQFSSAAVFVTSLDRAPPATRTRNGPTVSWTRRSRPSHLLSSSQQTETPSSHSSALSDSESFWGRQRSAEEIKQFVSNALASTGDVDSDPTKISTATTTEPQVEVASSEPPLVIIHNFISPDDCAAILEATRNSTQQMQRSTMGATQETSQSRTSSTAWLQESKCPGPLRRIAERTSRLSQLPPSHMENLQVVKYTPGQEFTLHTDHLDSFNDLECRGRLATCLVYLESPFKGGETSFPEFDVNVPPTRGTAVFFFNTLERPGMERYDDHMFLHVDPRLRHAGLPVLEGEKWICNRWMHPIDYGAGVRGA